MQDLVIVAVNIKVGGGKELLDCLIEELQDKHTDIKIRLLADISYTPKKMNNIELVSIKNPLVKISVFFRKVENALYFGNVPPFFKSKNSVLYLQNLFLLQPLLDLPTFFMRIKYFAMKLQLWSCIKNVDVVYVQTEMVKNMLLDFRSNVACEVLPFFRLCNMSAISPQKRYDFCYIAYPHPNKNYNKLFDALDILELSGLKVSIAVTVPNESKFAELLVRISNFQKYKFVELVNLGALNKSEVCRTYGMSKCMVFPSIKETLGLPLIEAAHTGCDILVSNLPHIDEIIYPSVKFDPNNADEIASSMRDYMDGKLPKTKVYLKNEIEKLIGFFEGGSSK